MWQRFTERARRVILLAQEEASKLNSASVGTEHLLLGLVREEDGVAAQVLERTGISLDGVRQEILSLVSPASESTRAAEPRLTPKARRILELSADEARRMRHNYIGTEHMLAALLREKDGLASIVLHKLGLNLELARQYVIEYMGHEASGQVAWSSGPEESGQKASGQETGRVVTHSHYSFDVTPQAQLLLSKAAEEAKRLNHKKIDTAHLVLAVLSTNEGASLLGDVDVEAARQRVLEYLKSNDFN